MPERSYKLVGALRIPPDRSIWIRAYDGAAPGYTEVVLADPGYYYPLPGTDLSDENLLYYMRNTVSAWLSANVSPSHNLAFALDETTGLITWTYNAPSPAWQLQIRWAELAERESAFLADWLRVGDPTWTLVGNTPSAGTRAHAYCLYPLRYVIRDLWGLEPRAAQSRSDSGLVQTLHIATHVTGRLGVRLDRAYPRQMGDSEWRQFWDFMERAGTGAPFRMYPDKTVQTAYVEGSNPWGWSSWVMTTESARYRPEPEDGEWYKRFAIDLDLFKWTGPQGIA